MRYIIDIESNVDKKLIRKGLEDTLHLWMQYKVISMWQVKNIPETNRKHAKTN